VWKLDVGIKNIGTADIDEAKVHWGEFRFVAGIVLRGTKKTHVAFDHPIPETAVVEYSLPDGKQAKKTVIVKGAIPAAAYKDRDMTVMFVVNSDTGQVTVEFLHFIQTDEGARLVPYGTTNPVATK
jgi:hypothetical protein